MPLAEARVHAIEVGGEERGLVAAGAGADFDDRVAVVERIARQELAGERCLEVGDDRLEAPDFGPRLGGHLGVVERNELARLRELVFGAFEPRAHLDDRRQPPMFTPQLGKLAGVQRSRVGERILDLFRAGESGRQPIAEGQTNRASGRLFRELLSEALDASGRVDETLLAREERVALRADVGMNFGLRGSREKRVAAGTLDGGRGVFRMDIGFHDTSRSVEPRWRRSAEHGRARQPSTASSSGMS